jgi:hypothetical protein
VSGAGGVITVVLLEWAVGSVAAASWTQSWRLVKRGHFRIIGWSVAALAVLTLVANRAATSSSVEDPEFQRAMLAAFAALAVGYRLVQYARTDVPGVVVGAAAGIAGMGALVATGDLIEGWPDYLAALELGAGAALLGAVTNGMLLGHWYLNQPGLKPGALARLTALGLVATAACGVLGLVGAGRLADASTEGAALGLGGSGDSFGLAFFLIWFALLVFTGVIVWMARRCIQIRSIQSATGLYYVALLTAGVSEFLVRYLMVNAT